MVEKGLEERRVALFGNAKRSGRSIESGENKGIIP